MYNLENVKNSHEGVLFLVKLQGHGGVLLLVKVTLLHESVIFLKVTLLDGFFDVFWIVHYVNHNTNSESENQSVSDVLIYMYTQMDMWVKLFNNGLIKTF